MAQLRGEIDENSISRLGRSIGRQSYVKPHVNRGMLAMKIRNNVLLYWEITNLWFLISPTVIAPSNGFEHLNRLKCFIFFYVWAFHYSFHSTLYTPRKSDFFNYATNNSSRKILKYKKPELTLFQHGCDFEKQEVYKNIVYV